MDGPIRDDLSPDRLRRLAWYEADRPAASRMFAIANALEGMSRADAVHLAGMARQALRDAVLRYNAEGLAALHNRRAPPAGGRFALVMLVVSTEAMSLILGQFGRRLAADEHAVMVLDRAGWHGASALTVPDNVTLVPLPSYSPELNPVEDVWTRRR